jgi:hypothetical protein
VTQPWEFREDAVNRISGFGHLGLVVGVTMMIAGCSGAPDVERNGPLPIGVDADPRLAAAMAGLIYGDELVRVDPDWPVGVRGHEASQQLIVEGHRLLAINHSTEAVRTFSDAVLAAPDLVDAYDGLGHALFLARRRPEALAAFRTVLGIDGSRHETRFALGATLQSMGRVPEAVVAWSEVVAAEPDHGPAHARLAAGHYLLGDLSSTRFHAERADDLGSMIPGQIAEVLENGRLRTAVVHAGPPAGEGSGDGQSVAIGPQRRIDSAPTAALANETTGSAATQGGSVEIVAGWNDWRDGGNVRVGISVSNDNGDTWSDLLLRAPPGHLSSVEGDPMTAFDPTTGMLWAGGVTYFIPDAGMWVARKIPGVVDFEEPVMTYENGNADKGWMGTGPVPGQPGERRLYLAFNLGLQYSTDTGDTWSTPVPVGSGWGHLPRVGPNGEVYVAYWDANDEVMVQRSLDGGVTVEPPVAVATRVDNSVWGDSFPGGFRVWPFSYIGVDPNDGTVYCVWFDVTEVSGPERNVDLLLSRSTDAGVTWSTPQIINGDSDPPGDQFFPWLEVDATGRLHLFFFDTRNTPQSDLDSTAWIDAYYSWSEDGGDTWTEHRLTPAAFSSSLASSDFLGDYNGMAFADGFAFPIYLSTQNGGTEVFTHAIDWTDTWIFVDGFESGDTSAWSRVVD